MTTPTTFGEMLRRQRERRGIALKTVADQTKIGVTLLVALERGDCSKWPGGIYSRAWIRAYAAAIGLDSDDIGAQFNRLFAANAFLEGETAAIAVAPAQIPHITPLRMTLEPDPGARARNAVRRGLFLLADLALSAIVASMVVMLTAFGFWTPFTASLLACHALGLFGGGGSAFGLIDRIVRRHARPHENAAGDSAVAEPA